MNSGDDRRPDLALLRGVVAPEILQAAEIASQKLAEAGIPHALAGGLAVGSHGYPRTTDDVGNVDRFMDMAHDREGAENSEGAAAV